tara:strand:- start:828 stop:1136 length:309 start_codon:yes stop_codon:yes gene_type:complete
MVDPMNPVQAAIDSAMQNITDAIMAEHYFHADPTQDIAVRIAAQGITLSAAIASLAGYYVHLTKGNPHEPASVTLQRIAKAAEQREQEIKTARNNNAKQKKG